MAIFSMLAASCGLSRDTASGPAATVTFDDGTKSEISSEELNEFYNTIADDPEFAEGAFGPAGVPAGLRASILSDMVIGTVLDRLLEENDAAPTEQDEADGVAGLESTIASFFPEDDDPVAFAQSRFETLPYLPFLAGLQAKQQALGTALLGDSAGETVSIPCSSHILLETEQAANDVIALLDDGGDFAELAMEFSTGPSGPTGGVLGCTDPSGFVPEFRDAIVDAPVGTIIGPVQTDFGFHVITVTATEEQIVGAPDPQTLVGTELLSTISQVDVAVDPTIGEWDTATGSILPPS